MLNKKNKIKKQSFMQSIFVLVFSQVIIKIFGLVYKWYLTNKEGFADKGNAIYSAGFSIYALLLTLSSIGVPTAVSKLVSEKISIYDYRGAHRIFKIALLTFSLFGLIGTFIMYFGSTFISKNILDIEEAKYSLMALSPSIFFVSVISVFRGYFNGRQTMKATANSQMIEQLFKTIFTIILVEILFVLSNVNTSLMAAGANLATSLATFISFIYICIYYKERRNEIGNEIVKSKVYKTVSIFKTIKNILYVSIPMSLSSILASLNRNIDSSTVKRQLSNFLSKEEALRQYGILSGKVDTLVTFPLSFNMAFATTLVPTITYLKQRNNYEEISKKILFSILITILICLPCSFILIVFSEPILYLLFPNASDGSLILKVSALSIVFTALLQTINGSLQGIGKLMIPNISLLIGVIIKFILNILLVRIKEIGIIGAVISTLVCHIVSFFISFIILKRNIKIKIDFIKFIIKPIIACFMMVFISYNSYILLNRIINEKLSIIISLLLAFIIYILLIICFKIFSLEEIFCLPAGEKIGKILKFLKIY